MDPTMIPRLPGPPINPMITDSEDPAPSLSDWHDHEPNLEFDDTELSQAPEQNLMIGDDDDPLAAVEFELSPEADEIKTDLEADNYEDQLRSITEVDELTSMQAYEKRKFIDFFGTDKQGQHIFAIFACLLPPKHEINNAAFIKYIIRKMEAYVQNDYVLVYFHQGLKDKPSINFLWNAYKDLDRSFKKNLKSLLVVHPTMFIKLVWNFFKPFISDKFKSKLVYVSSLSELQACLGVNPKLPEHIYQFDERYNAKPKAASGTGSVDGAEGSTADLPKTTQFGTTLKFIATNSPCLNYIPPIVRKCVDHLSISVIDTEGIFRRSGSYARINALKQIVNAGEMQSIDFKDEDTFVVAGLLKAFLRDLHEPLLTYELYDEITKFLEWSKEERSRNVKLMLREKLPIENYELFKYIVEFLVKVEECKDLNKMTTSNLAIVFGPNLIWAKHNHMSLEEVGPINAFMDYVLQNHRDIYILDINQKEPVD